MVRSSSGVVGSSSGVVGSSGGFMVGGGGRGGAGSGGVLLVVPVVVRVDGVVLVDGTDELLTTRLHDTGKGRAGGKSHKNNGGDHFEKLKGFP